MGRDFYVVDANGLGIRPTNYTHSMKFRVDASNLKRLLQDYAATHGK